MLRQSYGRQNIRLIEDFLEQKHFTGSMPLPTPNHSFKTCGDPEDLTSTTIAKKCSVKIAWKAGTLHPGNPFGVPLPEHSGHMAKMYIG